MTSFGSKVMVLWRTRRVGTFMNRYGVAPRMRPIGTDKDNRQGSQVLAVGQDEIDLMK